MVVEGGGGYCVGWCGGNIVIVACVVLVFEGEEGVGHGDGESVGSSEMSTTGALVGFGDGPRLGSAVGI